MTSISSNLSQTIKTQLRNADEIWVAVGLLNSKGLQFLLDAVPQSCRLNFVVGVDLPTDPKALSKLVSLKGKRLINANVLTKDFFHPKVYVIKASRRLAAFVGSANCTMGGFEDNIEMTIESNDNTTCKELITWFEKELFPKSDPLTTNFIKDYKPKYDNRIKRRKKEKEEIEEFKEKEKVKAQANIKARAKLIAALKRIRNSKDYDQNVKHRQNVVRRLKKSLDYPHFNNINLDSFFPVKELGTIVPIKVKSKILANRRKFSELMKFLCDEKVPIKTNRLGTQW